MFKQKACYMEEGPVWKKMQNTPRVGRVGLMVTHQRSAQSNPSAIALIKFLHPIARQCLRSVLNNLVDTARHSSVPRFRGHVDVFDGPMTLVDQLGYDMTL